MIQPITRQFESLAMWVRQRWTLLALAGIVVVGAALRIYRIGDRSLWLDEGLTAYYARLSWPQVLGLEGVYDNHPPLYYALIKGVSLVLPEVDTGRIVNAVAGIATLLVLFALVRTILDVRAALVATALLAIAPMHIWFSQEARMYAPMLLGVAVSYFALLKIVLTGRLRWVVLYGVALAFSMYMDYSAFFGLAPQIVVVAAILVRDRGRAVLAIAGVLLGLLLYLPWLRLAADAISTLGARDFLEVSPALVAASILSITGLDGFGSFFYSTQWVSTAWNSSEHLRFIFIGAASVVLVVGSLVLLRRSTLAASTVLGMLCGTVLAAIVVTLFISPSYSDRTVITATVGWVVLCGAAAVAVSSTRSNARASQIAISITTFICIGVLAIGSAFTSIQMISAGDKPHWRQLSDDVVNVATFGYPIILYPVADMSTFVDLYHPGKVAQTSVVIAGDEPVTLAKLDAAGRRGAVWFAYYRYGVYADRQRELEALGYQRVLRANYFPDLFLELYALPGGAADVPSAENLGLQADHVEP